MDLYFIRLCCSLFNHSYLFCEKIHLGRISLLHYDLHNILSFKRVASENGNIVNLDLYKSNFTYCLLFKSTFGYIFSISCFKDSLKLSLYFLSRKRPSTVSFDGFIPTKIVPPFALRKDVIALVIVHLIESYLKGIL